jgi:hypothetical protein
VVCEALRNEATVVELPAKYQPRLEEATPQHDGGAFRRRDSEECGVRRDRVPNRGPSDDQPERLSTGRIDPLLCQRRDTDTPYTSPSRVRRFPTSTSARVAD